MSRRLRRWTIGAVAAVLVFSIAGRIPVSGSQGDLPSTGAALAVIEEYQGRIPELMAEQGIPGLAVALVDSGFVGWLHFPSVERMAMHLPLALTVLGGWTVVLVVVGWLRGWWPKLVRGEYAALALVAITLVAQFAVWHLIGWGPA